MQEEILVVDDEKELCSFLRDLLQEEGFKVTTSENGMEALNTISKKEFALVVVDFFLPEISGIEIMRAIKKRNPESEVIVMSGNATLDSAIDATNDGAGAYITKPFSSDHFVSRVNKVLEKRRLLLANKRLERDLIAGNKSLQIKAGELEKAYRELQKAQKKLLKSERLAAIGQIAVSVKHSINNPLSGILNSLWYLLNTETEVSQEGKEILRLIEGEAKKINAITSKLSEITDPVAVEYVDNVKMIDLEQSVKKK